MNTIKAWISVLEASYLITLVPAWHVNTRKQAVKAPKLHFLDSGLICHLLGIHEGSQLPLHPLRGAIFESWMVSEILKARLNRGLAPEAFHYREPRGPEVDLMVRTGRGWVLAEAKSAQTVDREFFRHLETLSQRLGASDVADKTLVYGGDTSQTRSTALVIPWREIAQGPWT